MYICQGTQNETLFLQAYIYIEHNYRKVCNVKELRFLVLFKSIVQSQLRPTHGKLRLFYLKQIIIKFCLQANIFQIVNFF